MVIQLGVVIDSCTRLSLQGVLSWCMGDYFVVSIIVGARISTGVVSVNIGCWSCDMLLKCALFMGSIVVVYTGMLL